MFDSGSQQICTGDCAGKIVDFLESTEECRKNEDNQEGVYFLENRLCGFKDGIDNLLSSCLFLPEEGAGDVIEACIAWWYPGDNDTCPNENCTKALETAVTTYGCCYNGIFGDKEFIKNATE